MVVPHPVPHPVPHIVPMRPQHSVADTVVQSVNMSNVDSVANNIGIGLAFAVMLFIFAGFVMAIYEIYFKGE